VEQERILLDKKATAALLSISLRSVDYLVAAGRLRPIRIGKRVLFRRSALEAFAQRDHTTKLKSRDSAST
jgi:excisionase family DNA binding protein